VGTDAGCSVGRSIIPSPFIMRWLERMVRDRDPNVDVSGKISFSAVVADKTNGEKGAGQNGRERGNVRFPCASCRSERPRSLVWVDWMCVLLGIHTGILGAAGRM
jgi:hypothetical protein